MDFVKSHFGKMQVPFCEEKSVQLVRVAFFRSDFLQNPYFRVRLRFEFEIKNSFSRIIQMQ